MLNNISFDYVGIARHAIEDRELNFHGRNVNGVVLREKLCYLIHTANSVVLSSIYLMNGNLIASKLYREKTKALSKMLMKKVYEYEAGINDEYVNDFYYYIVECATGKINALVNTLDVYLANKEIRNSHIISTLIASVMICDAFDMYAKAVISDYSNNGVNVSSAKNLLMPDILKCLHNIYDWIMKVNGNVYIEKDDVLFRRMSNIMHSVIDNNVVADAMKYAKEENK